MNSGSAKQVIRTRTREAVAALTTAQRQEYSRAAACLLESQPLWRNADSFLFYAPLPDEVDLWKLVEDSVRGGKRVYLPKYVEAGHYVACEVRNPERDLAPGKFGVREPIASSPATPLNRLDFVLVPGIAFDLHGRRLGRGKGFYDRLLADVRGKTCGVAFDEQIVPEIPIEPHDIPVHCILTPTRWLEF